MEEYDELLFKAEKKVKDLLCKIEDQKKAMRIFMSLSEERKDGMRKSCAGAEVLNLVEPETKATRKSSDGKSSCWAKEMQKGGKKSKCPVCGSKDCWQG